LKCRISFVFFSLRSRWNKNNLLDEPMCAFQKGWKHPTSMSNSHTRSPPRARPFCDSESCPADQKCALRVVLGNRFFSLSLSRTPSRRHHACIICVCYTRAKPRRRRSRGMMICHRRPAGVCIVIGVVRPCPLLRDVSAHCCTRAEREVKGA
jgi:hypothetical protein